MIKNASIVVLAGVMALGLLFGNVACETTETGGVADFWNKPAVQAQLQTIQDKAFAFLNRFLTTHLGATKSVSGQSAAINATVAHLKKEYPKVPDSVLRGAAVKASQEAGGFRWLPVLVPEVGSHEPGVRSHESGVRNFALISDRSD